MVSWDRKALLVHLDLVDLQAHLALLANQALRDLLGTLGLQDGQES